MDYQQLGFVTHFHVTLCLPPQKYMGLDFMHLHTMQEIARLKDLINHTYQNTTTVKLYRTST
jgi:hypothetical protein